MPYGNYNHQKYIESHRRVNRDSIFKKGQWVVPKKGIKKPSLVLDTYLGNGKYPQQLELRPSSVSICYAMDYELWTPSPEEWVVFYKTNWKYKFRVGIYKTIPDVDQYTIEPYTCNYLPTHFIKGTEC